MIDGLPTSAAAALGLVAASGWGVVGYFFRLYFRGDLVPRASVDQLVAEHARETSDITHDRDEWRAESRIKDAQLAERDEQLRVVAVIGETTKRTLEAVTIAATNARPPGARQQEPL
jgi:hypothetical protein